MCYLAGTRTSESVKVLDVSERLFRYAYLVRSIDTASLFVAWLLKPPLLVVNGAALVRYPGMRIEQNRWVDHQSARFLKSIYRG